MRNYTFTDCLDFLAKLTIFLVLTAVLVIGPYLERRRVEKLKQRLDELEQIMDSRKEDGAVDPPDITNPVKSASVPDTVP